MKLFPFGHATHPQWQMAAGLVLAQLRAQMALPGYASTPTLGLLYITGPQTVFWSASEFLETRGAPGYVRHTVSMDGGVVVTTEGVGIDTRPVRELEDLTIDTIVVPGA